MFSFTAAVAIVQVNSCIEKRKSTHLKNDQCCSGQFCLYLIGFCVSTSNTVIDFDNKIVFSLWKQKRKTQTDFHVWFYWESARMDKCWYIPQYISDSLNLSNKIFFFFVTDSLEDWHGRITWSKWFFLNKSLEQGVQFNSTNSCFFMFGILSPYGRYLGEKGLRW